MVAYIPLVVDAAQLTIVLVQPLVPFLVLVPDELVHDGQKLLIQGCLIFPDVA